MIRIALIAFSALLLAACGEIDQSKSAANTNRGDVPPWQGANDPYVAKGWQPGNQTAWETQMRTRSQYQNEYTRVN